MRSSLSAFQNSLLMCSGRILHWKDRPELNSRQVTIGNPVFKIPDPSRHFSELEIAGKEDHVNLFVPYEHLPSYDIQFVLNEKIFFVGYVNNYTRRDGSSDFGIASITQFPIARKIEKLNSQMQDVCMYPCSNSLVLLHDIILPEVNDLLLQVEVLGDRLPTFTYSKGQVLRELHALKDDASRLCKAMQSRRFRRKYGKKSASSFHALVSCSP